MASKHQTLQLKATKRSKQVGIWREHTLRRYNGRKPYRVLAHQLIKRVKAFKDSMSYATKLSHATAYPDDIAYKFIFPNLTPGQYR